jgi:hypothetical protein
MSRPSFQFYHGDWISNAKLRRCTHEEKGAWIDILCLMADSDEFGVIRWPLADLAQAVGAKPATLKSLVRKGVLKGAEEGETCEAYIYTPRSGRKDGAPVALIPEQDGPIWYSSKQVRDDYVAHARAAYARTQGGATTSPKQTPNSAPKGGIGADKGDVLPSPSPSPTPLKPKTPTPARTEPPPIGSTRSGAIATRLRAALVEVHAMHPTLIAWAESGVTDAQLDAALATAQDRKPPPAPIPAAYFDKILRDIVDAKPAPLKRSKDPDFSTMNYREGVSDDGRF